MRELPKLNKVAVDDEPEPKPEKEKRDSIPYLIILVALLCRLILDCSGIPSPLIISWQSWWITVVVMSLTGTFVLPYLEKKYDNEKTKEKIHQYYICTCVSFLGVLTFTDRQSPILMFMFIISIILVTSHIFQFLLTRKK
jgi:quinol-cytochrome oxidoreductase complex cytochrome b subunit